MSVPTVAAPRPGEPVLGLLNNGALEAMVLATSRDPNAKITVLLFHPSSKQPAFAVKFSTSTDSALAVDAEGHALTTIRAIAPPDLLVAIPRVVDLLNIRERRALITTALPGHTMSARYHDLGHTSRRSTVARDFALAGDWIARLQSNTAGHADPVDMGLRGTLLDRLFDRLSGRSDAISTVTAVEACLARLRNQLTPRTAVHGDFWMGNVLVNRGGVAGVVDWENGESRGEPTRDVMRFALAYALYLDRHTPAGRRVRGHSGLRAGRWGNAITYAIDGHGWFPELFRDFVGDHLQRLGVARSAWRDGVLAGLAEIAATTDDPTFASHHGDLLRELTTQTQSDRRST